MPESSLVTSYKWLCGSVGTMLTLVVRGLRFKFVIVLVIAGYSTETEENGHCLKMIYFNKYKSNGTSISDLDGQVSEFGLEHRLVSRSWRRRHFLFRQRTSGFLVSWRQPGNVCLVTAVHRVVAGRAVGVADPFFHVTCAKIIFLNLWPMLKIYLNGRFSEFYLNFLCQMLVIIYDLFLGLLCKSIVCKFVHQNFCSKYRIRRVDESARLTISLIQGLS